MESAARALSLSDLSIDSDNPLARVFWVVAFVVLTAVGAQVQIPHDPVPFTLQTMFVLLAGAFLGKWNGFISMVSYLACGVAAFPVFAGGSFGLIKLIGPSGGYLLAFPLAAFVVGLLARRSTSYYRTLLSMAAGLVIIFAAGTAQLNALVFHDWGKSFASGFLIFSWWDIVKLGAASSIYHFYRRRIAP
ncbi:MAG TPA: biotin transporter BioY [Bacteroidota bacterium]|nr:biotin transporter BioY [Bacteroidota bacterium]